MILKKEVILLGDLNCNWLDKINREALKQIMDGLDFVQIIEGPTRITTSSQIQIDLIFSNKPGRVGKTLNCITGLSDHNLILISRKLTKKRFHHSHKPMEQLRIPKREFVNFERAVQQINWVDILNRNGVEADCRLFATKLDDLLEEFTRKVKNRDKNKNNTLPWLNNDIFNLMKERDLLLKRALTTKSIIDRHRFTLLCNKVTKAIRNAKANFFTTIINEAKGNTKLIWEQMNNLLGINHRPKKQLELKINDMLIQDPAQIASAFNKYFIDSVTEIAQTFPLVTETIIKTDNSRTSFCIQLISELKTKAIINSLKTSMAKDIYRMDSAMLKFLKDHLACPISQIINLSILQGAFPSAWKTTIVSQLYTPRILVTIAQLAFYL